MGFLQQGCLPDSGFALDQKNTRPARKLAKKSADLGSLCFPADGHFFPPMVSVS